MPRNKSNLIRSAGTPQGVQVPLESTFPTSSTTIPLMSPALPSLALNQQNVTIITNPQNISQITTIDPPISATLSQMPKGHLIYLCENCKKPFNYLSELCKHDRIKHSKAQPYKCKLCPKYKGFLKGYVTEHIRREHQNKLKPNVHPNTFVEEDKVFLSNEKAKLMKQRKKIMTVSKNQQAQQKIELSFQKPSTSLSTSLALQTQKTKKRCSSKQFQNCKNASNYVNRVAQVSPLWNASPIRSTPLQSGVPNLTTTIEKVVSERDEGNDENSNQGITNRQESAEQSSSTLQNSTPFSKFLQNGRYFYACEKPGCALWFQELDAVKKHIQTAHCAEILNSIEDVFTVPAISPNNFSHYQQQQQQQPFSSSNQLQLPSCANQTETSALLVRPPAVELVGDFFSENSEHFNENDSNETEESDSQQTQTETATQESNTEQLEIDFEGTSFTVTVDGVLAELLEASATSSQLAKIIFICEHCHCSGFPDWTALCQHIRGRHSKVKPFRCKFPNCSVEEKLKCVLERHVVNEHKQSKPNVIKSFIFTNQQKIDCENKKLKNWLSSKTYRKLVKEIEQSAQQIIAEKKSKT